MSKHSYSRKGSRLDRSFAAYKDFRKKHLENGYALDKQLTKKEYAKVYEEATSLGMKNIARTFASEDRLVSYREAATLSKTIREAMKIDKATGEAKGFQVRRKIEEGEPGYVAGQKKYKMERIDLTEYDLDPADFSIKALKQRGLSEAFNELREAGLTAREAGSIIDEAYGE